MLSQKVVILANTTTTMPALSGPAPLLLTLTGPFQRLRISRWLDAWQETNRQFPGKGQYLTDDLIYSGQVGGLERQVVLCQGSYGAS